MMKQVLVVTFDFPPQGGSGVVRVTKFTKYLPEFGWQPIVVASDTLWNPDESLARDVPPGTPVQRVKSPYVLEASERPPRAEGILLATLDATAMPYRCPEGAYYVIADFDALSWRRGETYSPESSNDRAFAEYIAHEIGVAAAPGSNFYAGSGGQTRVRFNFAKKEVTLHEAARRLRTKRWAP